MVSDIFLFFAVKFAEIVDFMRKTYIFGNITLLGWYIAIAVMSILISVFIWLLIPWKGYLNPSSTYISKSRYEKNKGKFEKYDKTINIKFNKE